ncbi:hypothetical protein J2129_000710 [Methanofollis sp. W23]|uniref:hypothetical protein n=1 Tax=Methanofollis sp. W23 TaxID=2817849 RepID=UPI001DBFAC0C|nr:hypothetical protein [Methanofollis sp. W23]MBP2145256.1 hypothetical protein [Methanofollis sp. W23]
MKREVKYPGGRGPGSSLLHPLVDRAREEMNMGVKSVICDIDLHISISWKSDAYPPEYRSLKRESGREYAPALTWYIMRGEHTHIRNARILWLLNFSYLPEYPQGNRRYGL